MILVSARFKGLKGIYSKSGKKEIIIDFTKCSHKIIYIIGKNGSGKSTLMSVLHPFPDSPTMYIDKEIGEKEITYVHDGTYYNILIQYPVYANGTRAVSKAYIRETTPTGTVELNPNGTIGSYKDVLNTKFALDPNFISLSYLSTEDRGIVDKKPADRKKAVASLLESIEVYNEIHKTLSSKSTVMKSLMGTITNKINTIGDSNKLISQREAYKQRIKFLTDEKQELEKKISAAEATINILDPNNSLQTTYKNLIEELDELKNRITVLKFKEDLSIEDVNELYVSNKELLVGISKDIESYQNSINELLIDRDEDAKRIAIKTQKLNGLLSSSNIADLRKSIAEYKKKIFEYEKVFKEIGIDGNCLTTDEYTTALSVLEDLRTSLTNIKSYADETALNLGSGAIIDNIPLAQMVIDSETRTNSMNNDIVKLREKVSYYTGLINNMVILKKRPAECNIDTCSFLTNAMEAMKEEPDKNLMICTEKIDKLKDEVAGSQEVHEGLKLALRVYNDLNNVLRNIKLNAGVLNKIPIGKKLLQGNTILERFRSGDQFNDIYDLYQYIEYANYFSMYNNDKKVLGDLEAEYRIIKSQESIVNDLQTEINELVKNTADIDNRIQDFNDKILSLQKQKVNIESNIEGINNTIVRLKKLKECNNRKAEIESKINVLNDNISKISVEIDNINKLNSRLNAIVSELNPLIDEQEKIKYQCNKLYEYQTEWEQYNQQYSIIEMLKKYSSPTKGGIQTIFMQLYMDKTLNMSNQLLQMMFGGELQLLPYVINENEFRIPVQNLSTNLITDDISNCSTSEKCMVAMIMSFILAFQGSNIYNIVRLDEIDGGLDQYNRSIFPQILNNIMGILNIDQCIIVSHASESDMSDVDIISLTPVSHETMKGNVIFQL